MLRVLDLTDNDNDPNLRGWGVNLGKTPKGETEYWVGLKGFDTSNFKLNIDPNHFLDITLPGSVHPTAPVTLTTKADTNGDIKTYVTSADEHTDRTILAFNIETRSIEAITAVTITNGKVVGFELQDEGFAQRMTLVLIDIDRDAPLTLEYEYGFPGGFVVAKRTITYPPASKPALKMDISKAICNYEEPVVKVTQESLHDELASKGILYSQIF